MKFVSSMMRRIFGVSVRATAKIKGPGYGAHGDHQNQMWYN